MEWQEISVKTEAEAIEAVSEVFHRLGAGGVVIEDPEEFFKIANSGLWDACELPKEMFCHTYTLVKGYLPADEKLSCRLEELKEELVSIAGRLGKKQYEINILTINEEDWANSWKIYFKPLKIGEKIVIRPTWELYDPKEGEIVLDIDPGAAFGTGSHITTILCARALEKYVEPGMRVIDVGTGTGILAIGAARLGAREVLALDYDNVAVKVAAENVSLNKVEDVVTVRGHDLLTGVKMNADLITANIVADVILKLLPQAVLCLKPGGFLIASGIISERKDEVLSVAGVLHFQLLEEKEDQGWNALIWQLKEC